MSFKSSMRTSKLIILGLVLVLCSGAVSIQDKDSQIHREFQQMLATTFYRIQQVAEKRPFRVKKMNDSLQKMALAVRLITSSKESDEAKIFLEQALDAYEGNHFALFLIAIIHDARNQTQEANQAYEAFLTQSLAYSEFEKSFIQWRHYIMVRRWVYEVLKVRGVSFEGREKDIQVRMPMQQLLSYLAAPSQEDRLFLRFFILVLIGGLIGLILSALRGINFHDRVPLFFMRFYFFTWLGYFLWIYDLAIGVALHVGNLSFTALFFILGLLGLSLNELRYWAKQHFKEKEPGFRKCPACKKEMSELFLECPFCRTKLKP